jgi:hypothetical protein
MNTQVGYIICVHRAATGIFGPISKPLNGNGAFLFFEDEARAQFVCDVLNARSMRPYVHYSIESDRSDIARTVVHHAMSELAHSEIPVHCEIAAITI